MAFKTSQMDQIALEYWYYGSLGRLRVDGRGFLHQTPILKNCSPERNQVAAHAQKRVTVPLKRRVKKVIWKPTKFAKIAKVTRIWYSAATTTTKHANKYRKNNKNKLSKSSDLYKGEWQRHLFSSDSVKFQTGVISVNKFLSCVKCSQIVPGRSTISFEEFKLSSLYNLADQVLL